MPNGWRGGFPLELGGGSTLYGRVLDGLIANVGTGHAADADGVEWRWREARALAFAAAASMIERAVSEHSPATASRALAYWRDVYEVPTPANEQEGRAACVAAEERQIRLTSIPDLEAALKVIDPRFSVEVRDDADELVTQTGVKAFQDLEGATPFGLTGNRGYARCANASTRFVLFVTFTTLYPDEGDADRVLVDEAEELLQDELPAWCSYQIVGSTGFLLDISQLDWVGLTEV